MYAEGTTPLYDAVKLALDTLQRQKNKLKDTRLYGIVVLSDGEDTGSKLTKQELISLLPTHPEQEPDSIKVFTIAYGGEADENTLREISASTNALMYKGSTEDIENVYLSISSYF